MLKPGTTRPYEVVENEIVQLVRDETGPVIAFETALVVTRLPKSRSGKILRGTMQKIADGSETKVPVTIDDPANIEEISDTFTARHITMET